jgi:monothiol glutaredoxin
MSEQTTTGGLSTELRERIAKAIAAQRIMLFMKGTPSMPQCGFSGAVVQVLKQLGVEYGSHNVLHDPEIREGLKAYSNWPTFPQLYVDGKLVGGADIVRDLHRSGQLAPLLGVAQG